MFIRSKLFKFLLPLLSYVLFVIVWAYNYVASWYNSVPEETQQFAKSGMGRYMILGYVFVVTLIIFLIFGLAYLLRSRPGRIVIYLLIMNLIVSSYCIWLYAITFANLQSNSFLLFLILALFAVSIFDLVNRQHQ